MARCSVFCKALEKLATYYSLSPARAGSFLLQCTLQWMLVTPGEIDDLRHLRLRHFVGINAANADTLPVHLQHNPFRVGACFIEIALEHVHDEFHRRVVVVQHQHLVEARPFGLRPGLGDQAGIGATAALPAVAVAVVAAVLLTHSRRYRMSRTRTLDMMPGPNEKRHTWLRQS